MFITLENLRIMTILKKFNYVIYYNLSLRFALLYSNYYKYISSEQQMKLHLSHTLKANQLIVYIAEVSNEIIQIANFFPFLP